MDAREPGFYWVRFPAVMGGAAASVEVACWDSLRGVWFICGGEVEVLEAEVEVLSPRLEPPA